MTRLQRAATRIGDGSAALAWRILSWPAAGEGWRACCGRTVWLGFCGWASWQIVDHQHATAALAAAGWLRAAWRSAAVAEAELEDGEDQELEEPEEPEEQAPAAPLDEQRTYLLGVVRGLIGDSNGVHLTELRDALVQRGNIPAGLRTAAVRLTVERLGIPVRDQLKIGRANRPGIHRDDLPPLTGGEDAATPPHLALVENAGSSAA